ncbi:golgin candidate 4-like isoform X2 [Camellia sinensis]|uniref:golgin candidate 4-like isoform X2 n=1 Tax=Camellia sinensis TaxID=4442 RepID=UPI0010361C0B|nr:golgin candidate 4-like isoform X2 [Camellia sinensis]
MWSTIANLKENLNKMALDVHHHDYDYDYDYHDDDEQQEEELRIYDSPNRNGHLVSDHRFSHNFAYSLQPSHSNGFEDSPDNSEVEQYKVEIKRLHESEAEIKALSVNYAALLKEKEDRISRLNEENSLLKQNLNATNDALNSSRNESFKTSTNSMNGLKKMEMNKIRDELNEKISEVRRLQIELTRRENAETDDIAEGLKRVIATLEKENNNLKMEKVELEAALKAADNSSPHKIPPHNHQEISNSLNEKDQSMGHFPGKEEMELSLQKLEKDLKETCQQRDKALQELNRLKQHLLDKESEESEKMDEDSKIIEELREKNEFLKLQKLNLEKALKHAIASQEEVKMTNNNELQKYEEIIDDLKRKLTSCMSTIDAKNVELLNLQTALGQYYAEIEAKEHLEGDMARAREELAKLSEVLKDAHQQAEILKSEKEDSLKKLSQAERILAEGRNRVNKLEEDNAKLHRAFEQSMSRINRMSMDSDYFVDRRIVIKLLVAYFQRNHSKEVLDLMVRMLGFSDEDKQRIGVAQQGAGKGVVRGVLGIPGRLVGGLWGGGSAESNANMASENQSFADLWVDFLLKETEEREKRESAEAINASNGDARTNATGAAFSFSRLSPSPNQNSPLLSQGNIQQSDHSDSEFSTVPLTSSEHSFQVSKLLPRY